MFIGRERELQALERLFYSDHFEFAVIYGRRRVGKTALISRFIQDKDAIYFMGVESSEKQNLENLSKSIMEYSSGIEAETSFLSFQAALEYVFRLAEKKRVILTIDEYPYVARASKSLASTLQLLIDKYKELPFVEDVIKVWRGKDREQNQDNYEDYPLYIKNIQDYSSENYAEAWENIALHKGQLLHERGFRGEGIDIAVIDAGFINLPQNSVLNNIRIKGARSFIYEDTNPYNTDEHGIGVVACMATDRSGYYVGTAPDAAYWLLRSEDVISGDYPVEEDYWVAAMEYADSVGVDLVNTSLSYIEYEWPFTSYKYEDMDGRTAMPTRAADIAVDKGIFVVCCAGNGGSWVGTPADSPNVLTVGAVTASGNIVSFTAYGMTVDGRMKPDVMSLGY